MNPFDAWRALGLAGRIAVGVVVAIVVGLVLWRVWAFVDAPRRAKEAETANRTATAYAASARAAMDLLTEQARREDITEKEIEDEVRRIQALPEAERYGASLAALCGMSAYRGDARCAELLRAHPEVLGGRGGGRGPAAER